MADTSDIQLRPLVDDDVEKADAVANRALRQVGEAFGLPMTERTPEGVANGHARIRHLAKYDPDGAVIAEQDGAIVGIGLALKRGSLWFLSLLAVQQDLQAKGVGKRLLDATLEYGADCSRAMICASPDPKALRRYARAGFALHPAYEANGPVDRAELPAGLGVREGDWGKDTDFVDELVTARRGAAYGPDHEWHQGRKMRLLIRDGGRGDRAFLIMKEGTAVALSAESAEAATRVLWSGIAEAGGDVTVGYLLGNQQWAIDVAMAARLSFTVSDTLCTRGEIAPPEFYIPSGIVG